MLVICLLNNIVLRGRGFCTSSIAQITGNVPRLLADIVGIIGLNWIPRMSLVSNDEMVKQFAKFVSARDSDGKLLREVLKFRSSEIEVNVF